LGSNRGKGKEIATEPRLGLFLAVLLIALSGCSNDVFVERISIVNETDFPADVDVTTAARDGWVGLGVVGANEERDFGEIVDQGEVWIFRFDYAAMHHEEVRIARNSLEESDWQVDVPAAFGESLQQLGVEPPP
jgi:hypothetical protein